MVGPLKSVRVGYMGVGIGKQNRSSPEARNRSTLKLTNFSPPTLIIHNVGLLLSEVQDYFCWWLLTITVLGSERPVEMNLEHSLHRLPLVPVYLTFFRA